LDLQSDITRAFIDKKYLVDKGPADILLYPEVLFKFLKKQKLIDYFSNPDQLNVAYFRDAEKSDSESESCTIEYKQGKFLQRASIQVMLDSLIREELLCPVRINKSGEQYELLLAPLSERNICVLNQFYQMFRLNIAKAYRVRRDVINVPFKSSELPNSLAIMFIEQNAVYDSDGESVDGMSVSVESFNPDATIMKRSPEELMKLYKK